MNDLKFSFRAKIEKCLYKNDKNYFKVYTTTVDTNQYPFIKLNSYHNCKIIGKMPELLIGTEYDVVATEKKDKYGVSYNVINITRNVPKTKEDVLIFLKTILTEKQATTIVNVYPNIIEMVMNGDTENVDISKLNGIGEKTIEKIKNKINYNFYLFDLVAKFKNILSLNILMKLHKMYLSVDLIIENITKRPYSTLTKINGIGFKTADAIVIKLQEKNVIKFGYDIKTSEDRCHACIIYLLYENENEGNTKANLATIRNKCHKLVPECSKHFSTSIKHEDIYYNKDTMDIAIKETYNEEKYIANDILNRASKTDNIWNYNIEKYRNVNGFDLTDEQMILLDSVCKNNLTILTAPAGSGKTYSTKALVHMLRDNMKSFILSTPTGKSAKKLSESTGEKTSTIHRLLGYDGKYFSCDNGGKIDVDVIIIDEVGMVDINLFYNLLKSLNEYTKIVLIGDSFQLNSVGYGALLRDLSNCSKLNKITFSKIFRMGEGGVLTACTYVRQNQKFIYNNEFTQIGKDKSYSFIPVKKNNINNTIVALYKKLLTKYNPKDVTVISSFNVGNNGCGALNKLLQPIANPNATKENVCVEVGNPDNKIKFYVGDIVVQCKNNYHTTVYKFNEEDKDYIEENDYINSQTQEEIECFIANGEQGKIVQIKNNSIIIKFENNFVTYFSFEILENIKHAFALSVHKMQGSQNKIIIFCCPSSHMFMLSNNIIYTAISRAEKQVYHLTDAKTLNTAMKKSDSKNRLTFLQDMLNI